ncbi:MAG: flagellar filament capping protein FliD [Lachnospiraceae bacterium]
MAVRITGLVSGMDTDSIVQELVSAYSTKTENIEKKQTKLSWKQDAWKEMNTKIYSFYSKSLTDFKFMSNFDGMKKTTLSDSTKATITAGTNVTNGTQTLKINQLATAGYLTGAELKSDGEKYTGKTKLSELGITDKELTFKVGDEEKKIKVTGSMTINDFTKALNETGVKASFDEKQQRFFINSKESGDDFDFGFVTDSADDVAVLKKLGLATADDMVALSARQSTEEDIKDLKATNEIRTSAIQLSGMSETEFDALSTEEQDTYLEAAIVKKDDEMKGVDTSTKDYTDKSYIQSRMGEIESAQIENYTEQLKQTDKYAQMKKEYAAKQDASNAIIELNGATFEGSSNTFTINGLTITAKGVSESTMTLVTETDVDAVYDKIKGFLNEYNEVIKAMDEAYNAESAKGYEPLTDEEKESMSDDEVEKWEKKIKDALLRRDSTLNSIASSMKVAMAKSYTINGKTYSLSSFGINTQSYFTASENEKGVYHIDGNQDDDTSKANADKLKAAIASDPDTVAAFFNELAKGVYDDLDKRMKSTTLSSAYKVYNDKQLQNEYDDYSDELEKWQKKLEEMEDYYYDKFSAMESALSTLNSQQSQLSGLLGM